MMTKLYKEVKCADGACVSIQAGRHLYCEPRNDYGPYSLIEAGFPSVTPPESWFEYAGDDMKWTETIYGYMPIALVHEFIELHGGMIDGELPEFVK